VRAETKLQPAQDSSTYIGLPQLLTQCLPTIICVMSYMCLVYIFINQKIQHLCALTSDCFLCLFIICLVLCIYTFVFLFLMMFTCGYSEFSRYTIIFYKLTMCVAYQGKEYSTCSSLRVKMPLDLFYHAIEVISFTRD